MVFHYVALMLFCLIIMERIAVRLNSENRLFAHTVDNEKIQMRTVVAGIFEYIQIQVTVMRRLSVRETFQSSDVTSPSLGYYFFDNALFL